MTIKVSKPAINIREELADLKQDTGLKGQELMRADTMAELRGIIGTGRKNQIINGDFAVSQRGDYTSATSAVHTTFYLDRWCPNISTVTGTIQDTGFAVKLVATSSATGTLRLRQKLEEMSYLSGKTVTISCQMKSNDANSRIGVYADGWQSTTATHTGGGAWETLSITLTLPSGVSSELSVHLGIDGASSADVSITSGAYCEIKEAQMELGKVATEFEHRSYGEELALCQRYFYNIFHGAASKVYFDLHQYSASGNAGWSAFTVPYPVPMRASPTFIHSMTNAKCTGAALTGGTDTWTYYMQNQGYANVQGNGDASTYSGGGEDKGVIGTYYVSATHGLVSHIVIASGTTFQFDAEL